MASSSRIFLVPCDSGDAREQLSRTVKSGVSSEDYGEPSGDDDIVRLWGVDSDDEGSWAALEEEDYLLFYTGKKSPEKKSRYSVAAKVIDFDRNSEVATKVWPELENSDSPLHSVGLGELLIYLEEPIEVDIPADVIAEYDSYAEGQPAFQRMATTGLEAIKDEYGGVESFVKDHSTGHECERSLDIPELENDEQYREIIRQLESKGQLVLYGPPGTGKTYHALRFAKAWLGQQNEEPTTKHLRKVTFHPSFTYEDFIEGLSVSTNTSQDDGKHNLRYEIQPGIFKDICDLAREEYESSPSDEDADKYVLIIDEMNRANLSQVFGELVTLLEKNKRGERLTLAHSKEDEFTVPPNLYIIGTMNTSDQSIALIDSAIRRRFRFVRLGPDYEFLHNIYGEATQFDQPEDLERRLQLNSVRALEVINDRILEAADLGQGKQIGHSYLLSDSDSKKYDKESLYDAWKYEILPLIEEYYFGDFHRIRDQVFAGVDDNLTHTSRPEFRDFTAEDLDEALRGLVETE